MNDPSNKIYALFVDDEQQILKGLERSLRQLRADWEMTFETDPKRALQLVRKTPFSLIVSDMRMPEMNGVDFLRHVARLCPGAVRVILSGYSDRKLALDSVPVTHVVLAKPCEPAVLHSLLSRMHFLLRMPVDPAMRTRLAAMTSLPVCPLLYQKIVDTLAQPDSSVHEVGKLIVQDLAISAKLLQLVNSAFFGLSRRIVRPEEAVSLLGLELVKNIVLGLGIFSQFDEGRVDASLLGRLTRHSFRVALLASRIAASLPVQKGTTFVDDAFLAGMMHDLGSLVIMEQFSHPMFQINPNTSTHEAGCCLEEQSLGLHHCFVGSFLIGIWGLPLAAMNAAAFHHAPATSPEPFDPVLLAVHVADALITRQEMPGQADTELLDMAFLEKVGQADRLPEWKKIYHDIATKA